MQGTQRPPVNKWGPCGQERQGLQQTARPDCCGVPEWGRGWELSEVSPEEQPLCSGPPPLDAPPLGLGTESKALEAVVAAPCPGQGQAKPVGPGQALGNGGEGCAWLAGVRRFQGEMEPLSSAPTHGPSFLLSAFFLPDQFCIFVQHRQNPNDKITSIHHVRDDPVQVCESLGVSTWPGDEEAI